MKIMSFNVNGIRARMHQVKEVIEKHQPDIIGLQEIKVASDVFPDNLMEGLGYHYYHHGQKGHYGVALFCKDEPLEVRKGYPTDDEDAQRRIIMGDFDTEFGKLTVINGYFPQGENRNHPTKFPAKEKFYADLAVYLRDYHPKGQPIVIVGDMNISPTDLDIGIGEQNKKRWLRTGKTSFLPEEREWLATIKGFGLKDTFRELNPNISEKYSWFDYRSRGFDDNRGLRIDLILASESLQQYCVDAGIDLEIRAMEKPSDHAPIWATFKK